MQKRYDAVWPLEYDLRLQCVVQKDRLPMLHLQGENQGCSL
jgi:hypothetical protein